MSGKKFAILQCADDPDYVKKMYGGYVGVFTRMLEEDGETWNVFKVLRGEFPPENEVGEYDGFVISGSCSDANGDDMWICKLVNLLKKLDELKKKILGICFGHQVLARALGGRTGRNTKGWDIGITKVHLQASQKLTSLIMPASLSIIQCHRDEVLELPPKAVVLAWSNKTGVEMFTYGDYIMGIQGHPEYTKDILLHLIDRVLNLDLIQEDQAKEVKSKLKDCDQSDREVLKKLCTKFLKGRL